MRKIAVFYGDEGSFPFDLISYMEDKVPEDVQVMSYRADVGSHKQCSEYSVIVDRISHCIPFFKELMKQEQLSGAFVINDPFRTIPEKFYASGVASQIGVLLPATFLLPPKIWCSFVTKKDLALLNYPISWEELYKNVVFPAYLKPVYGGGGRGVVRVNNPQELHKHYDSGGMELRMLQHAVEYKDYIRALVIGDKVRLCGYMPPDGTHEGSYTGKLYSGKMAEQLNSQSVALCKALSYRVNSIEWAINDDGAYAIDFCNQVPDARLQVLGKENYEWFLHTLGDYAIASLENRALAIE